MKNTPIALKISVTFFVTVLIVALSIVPGYPQPGDSSFVWYVAGTPTPLQKTMHVAAYAALASSLMWTFASSARRSGGAWPTFYLAVGSGTFLEWIQLGIPGRYSTVTDILLNALGAGLGIAFYRLLKHRLS